MHTSTADNEKFTDASGPEVGWVISIGRSGVSGAELVWPPTISGAQRHSNLSAQMIPTRAWILAIIHQPGMTVRVTLCDKEIKNRRACR